MSSYPSYLVQDPVHHLCANQVATDMRDEPIVREFTDPPRAQRHSAHRPPISADAADARQEFGVDVVSSADFIQLFEARWTDRQAGTLSSKIREPEPLFGGDEVIGATVAVPLLALSSALLTAASTILVTEVRPGGRSIRRPSGTRRARSTSSISEATLRAATCSTWTSPGQSVGSARPEAISRPRP